jgi:tetratricopeptide (TPR) repeat protein
MSGKLKFVSEGKTVDHKSPPPANICLVINILYYLEPFSQVFMVAEPLDNSGSDIELAGFVALKVIFCMLATGREEPINIFSFLEKFCLYTNSNIANFSEVDIVFVWDNVIKLIIDCIPTLREVFIGCLLNPLDAMAKLSVFGLFAQFNFPVQSLEEVISNSLSGDVAPIEEAGVQSVSQSHVQEFNAKMLQQAPEILAFAIESHHLPQKLRNGQSKSNPSKLKPCTSIRFPQSFDLAALGPPSTAAGAAGGDPSAKQYELQAVIALDGTNYEHIQAYYRMLDEDLLIKWHRDTGMNIIQEEVEKSRVIEKNYFNATDAKKTHPRLLIYAKKNLQKSMERIALNVSKAGQLRCMGDAVFDSAENPENYDDAKRYYEEAIALDETLKPTLQERMNFLDQIERNQKAQSFENQGDLSLGKRRFKEACDFYKMALRSATLKEITSRIKEKEEMVSKIISLEISNHLCEKGEDCLKNGSYSHARDHFAQAMKMNSDYIHLQSIVQGIDKTIVAHAAAQKVADANQAMKIGKKCNCCGALIIVRHHKMCMNDGDVVFVPMIDWFDSNTNVWNAGFCRQVSTCQPASARGDLSCARPPRCLEAHPRQPCYANESRGCAGEAAHGAGCARRQEVCAGHLDDY